MSTQPRLYLLEEEYLEIERKAECKSEYWQGEMLAMSGVSAPHCLISTNLLREANSQLRGRNCLTFGSDLRVRTGPGGLYCYPDFTIVSGAAKFHDSHRDTLENPSVIGEILSPSTELYDRRIGCVVALRDRYARVTFTPEGSERKAQ
jgi:Uma2 family endonuclease